MPKTSLDHDHASDSARAEEYARIEREEAGEAGHPTVRELTKRKRAKDTARVEQFARIERGKRA